MAQTLEEILDTFELDVRAYAGTSNGVSLVSESSNTAKQAITSLMKELVAEAKPAMAIISDDELGIDRARKSASNSALDVYEQNLLKALEKV